MRRTSSTTTRRLQSGLAVLCLLVTGCCSTFERDWRAAGNQCAYGDGLAGRWEGSWESHVNGHKGSLRAIITRCGENQYYARYRATYAAVLPFEFELPMFAAEQDGVYHFSGEADLGCLAGGVYTYTGQAAGGCYRANYCARKDHGVFTMNRVSSGGCGCCRQ